MSRPGGLRSRLYFYTLPLDGAAAWLRAGRGVAMARLGRVAALLQVFPVVAASRARYS